ncbi:Blp family class II bacteriocin [Streptococcus mutans]|uniref:Blp family class II bacteriocin n=2 Tax=Streptococcus mutans TaxID=1309 RepID=UPI0003C41CFA|nr:Blp family class II bacteriocin [Streptococcus mutans]ESS19447.1 hypothetical protein PLG01_00121 [Streptococcus mutans PKUSS-LG01]MCB4993569.1 Blp family class II bacteriocin [Streptococcus mutans]MDT9511673.1 Blp family class II bacteriocin [Streptococcus mutans]MDT9517016.1 Blp family class II bacteriocin [Streptococcus mutans]MDT9519001.1 Blp family class II bacteriocin [Streptococcus mutans]
MDTQAFEQFDVMDSQTLSTVEGGKVSGGEAVAAIGGLVGATLVTPYCVGTWGLIRSH